jgi:hypothetical protein
VIKILLLKMQAIWGAKFNSNISDPRILKLALHEWSEALVDLTDQQIIKAFEKARISLKFPPCPAEMREFAFDIVTPAKAFALAQNEEREEYRQLLCSWDWRNLQEKELKQKFYGVYDNYCGKKLMPKLNTRQITKED